MKTWLSSTMKDAGRARALKAGEHLFRLGDRTAGIYEIVSGQVRLARLAANGQEVTLYAASAGDIVAEASLFSPKYHCDAIATTDAIVRFYPKAALLAQFKRNPDAAAAFMAVLAREVMALRTRLEQRNIRSARDRVRHYLAVNAGADGRTLSLRGTLKQLASELGLSHEALYRALAELAAAGDIKREGRTIRLKGRRPYD